MTVLNRAVGRHWSLELTYTKEPAFLGFREDNFKQIEEPMQRPEAKMSLLM